jgi:predicted enzyme related to lactoylglutathione lyase
MIVFGSEAEAARAFFRETLGFDSVDAGEGWLIFALPPAELAVHPADGEVRHELYLMCDDIEATLEELAEKGVEVVEPMRNEGWGLLARIRVPGAGELGIYEPHHPTPLSG